MIIFINNNIDYMKKNTKEEFIKKAREVHGDKYDYSKVEYEGNHNKVCIICPEHGEFWKTPAAHINLKQGCKYCNGKKLNNKIFIEKARKVHGEKYDYSKVEYKNNSTKVCIICPEHGEFWQKPGNHLRGQGCPTCANEYSPTTEEWIIKAKKVHGNKYDYSKSKYVNTATPIIITCRKHGDFLSFPNNHLNGNGCPKCRMSKLENILSKKLIEKNISFVYIKKFDWLKNNKNLSLDFFLPDYNAAIECQGEQHLIEERKFANSSQVENDIIKNKLCKENNVKLYYFGSTDINDINLNKEIYNEKTYFTKIEDLLITIK